jgi:antirestriction protein ArdC
MTTRKREANKAHDFRQDLTNTIVGLIESGTAPWQKPWSPDDAGQALSLPFNATTGRAYRGANSLYLMARQMQMGSVDPRWCTYKQAQAQGWQVRKGEKGTTVEYWQFDREEERLREDGRTEKVNVRLSQPRVFYATVFNAHQIDGIPPRQPSVAKNQWEVSEAAERVLSACGVSIHHDQHDSAYYAPASDSIHLPPRAGFARQEDYYEVALHEVGHSTGHSSRLNRNLTGSFGSPEYAREELRAQMCSLYLSAELGVPFNPERHAAYQASWIKALKEDKNEIFRAARDAELMADYVIGLSREKTLSKEINMAEAVSPGAVDMQAAPQSPEVTPEIFQEASNDVAAYMDTAREDTAARASLAKEMRDKAKEEPAYRAALERITPNLATLTNARTTVQQRESLYTAELEAREQRSRDDPEVRDARMDQGMPEQLPLGQIPVLSLQDEQRYRSAMQRGDMAAASAIQQEAAADFQKEKGIQSGMMEAANGHINGQAKLYLPRDNGKYTGQIVQVNERYALQQLRDSNSFVAHPIGKLNGQQLKAGERHLMEYKDGALTVRDPEQAQSRAAPGQQADNARQGQERAQDQPKTFGSELVQLKNEHAGKDAKLVMAKDENGKAYTGTIIAETGDKVLQRVSDKYVVVHEKNKLARDVEVGSSKTLAYENGRISVLEPSQNRSRSREQEAGRAGERAPDNKAMTPEQERRESFFQARGIIMSQFGSQSKVRDAKTDIGDYKGAVVVITKEHVAQQLGANSFVVHEKDRLAGSFHKGSHVEIKYNNGRAISALTQQQREQTRDQSKGVSR